MTHEQSPSGDNLVDAIENRLHFVRQGEWLVQDDFDRVGGGDLYEWLPTRFRISTKGERYEIGVRREDIGGLFELTKTIGKTPLPPETVLTFWDKPSVKKFTAHEEDQDGERWFFMGVDIEPTIDSFQQEYQPLLFAYTLALRATIEGQTYEELVQNEWQAGMAKYAIDPGTQRTLLFGQFDYVLERSDARGMSEPVEEKNQLASDLSELSLVDDEFVLKYAPGTVRYRGETFELKDILVEAYNGQPEVEIMSLHSGDTDVRVTLQIPGDTSVTTFKDIEQLEIASVKVFRKGESEERVIPVKVSVEGDLMVIASEEDWFSLEIRTPKCEGCGIPDWQFPRTASQRITELSGNGLFYNNTSLGINRFFTTFEDDPKPYCADCIGDVVETYLEQQEYANEAYAWQRVEAELRDMGYADVEISEGERGWEKNTWLFYTSLEYTRGGRSITRFTGEVTLDDSGNFTSSMQPREFVDFR